MFVHLVCCIQYRVVKANADDAFYELQNPKEQIQAYVFDGNDVVEFFLTGDFSFRVCFRRVIMGFCCYFCSG